MIELFFIELPLLFMFEIDWRIVVSAIQVIENFFSIITLNRSNFRTCGLDAKYYCEECMRRGTESPIPARM